jgi:hypothetical protein
MKHFIERINQTLLSLQQSTYMDWLKSFLLVLWIPGCTAPFVAAIVTYYTKVPDVKLAAIMFFITLILVSIVILLISLPAALQSVVFFRYIPRISALYWALQSLIGAFVLAQQYGAYLAEYNISKPMIIIGVSLASILAYGIIIFFVLRFMNKRRARQRNLNN